jgi:ABC-type multidrug transport system ATPase subunit
MPPATAVVADQLAVGRDPRRPLLNGVNLAVAPGERYAILGGNGAGKTALLATLALLAPPVDGRLFVFEREPWRLARDDRAGLRRRIGAAVGDGPWLAEAGAAENLALALRVHDEDEREIAAVVGEFLAWLGLKSHAATPVTALSTGERRLLATARAAIVRPDLLVLDEPLAGLDARAAARTVQLVDELAGLGAAVVVATTATETARRLGCEIVALGDDAARASAPPLTVAS